MTGPAPPRGEIAALTSLRGVAAMAVVMQHFSATAQTHCAVTIPSLVPHGYLAVDLFFVLSGFIMAYTYLDAFRQRGIWAFGEFLGKRIARIVPLNLAVLLLFVLAGLISVGIAGRNLIFTSNDLAGDLLANALMLQGLGIGRNLNGPSWSISAEFAAYLLFPLFAAMAFTKSRIVPILAGLECLAALCLIALGHPRLGLGTDTTGENLIRCFAEFTLGLMAYRVFVAPGWAGRLGRDGITLGTMGACAALMALRLDLPAVLLFPLLIVSLAANTGRAARLMRHPWLHMLGVLSFSTYLLHQAFRPTELELLRALHPQPLGPASALAFALAGSLTVIPFAWLTYRGVERPGRVFVQALMAGKSRLAKA